MKRLLLSLFTTILFISITSVSTIADNNASKLNNITKQLNTIKNLYENGILEKTEYENSKNKLLKKKDALQSKKKIKKIKKKSTNLDKELEVIKKLYDDGILSKEEYEKTKKILIKNSEENSNNSIENDAFVNNYKLNIKKTHGKNAWERTEIIFKDYRIYTGAPGVIIVKRISNKKTLLRIEKEMKIKFYNNGEDFIEVTKNEITRPNIIEDLSRQKEDLKRLTKETTNILKNPEKSLKSFANKLKKSLKDPKNWKGHMKPKNGKKFNFNKEAIKLELKIEGRKILIYEGRYVNKFRAFFYQVLTANFIPFHFYISLPARLPIALNMSLFNKKIDQAVRKAKQRISAEYDVSMEEIDQIIERQINESAEEAVNDAVKDAVAAEVQAAVAESLGTAISDSFVAAIEQATGEAIDDAIQSELAAAIDAEIQRAVAMGIEEAAVAAGWQAYFDVIASGGTEAQAVDAAYDACGGPCEGK